MFTGLVTDVGEVVGREDQGESLRRLTIACHYELASLTIGASIACSGACLTVVDARLWGERAAFTVEAAAETLSVTTVGRWAERTRVNLERSLKIGDELGGHLVSGHVDGVAELTAREDAGPATRMTFRAPAAPSRFIATKGSVAIDGVSLTVNAVEGEHFSVLIIPHTLAVTTFGSLQVGAPVNLEVDLMARYAARLLESR